MSERPREFYVFAHRGAAGCAPENTLLSFAKALELGADWIEADVYSVEDNLVVLHDERLERTTNGTGLVARSALEYIRSLDAGEGQHIPLLTEVLDLLAGSAGLNIELKGEGAAAPTAHLIEQTLAASSMWTRDQFLVSSFDHHELLAFSSLMPEIRIGALTASIPLDYAAFAEALGAWSVHASLEFVNREFVEDAHARGKRIFVYTVNYEDDFARLLDLGVDGIFTDNSNLFCAGSRPT